ncbi:NAD-dependent epimerase/dehydratase family protein [Marinifilum fragile]|uniref:NAD-dependent epimerase/dehydratase family protein n=1 Tax=Marinifilum fragile TaxID=570161 RepID=UPI002AA6B5E6|nr:NAD-dependent epimerase/dehydratase family protein [Marinifilum fragile]
MRVLISGASGFLGGYIVKLAENKKWDFDSIGIHETDNIKCDLSKEFTKELGTYDYVIHAAGKAHMIPKSNKDSEQFYNVNFEGTKNLLKAIADLDQLPKAILFVSSVAVYGLETGDFIKETECNNATDPYGRSKALAEEYIVEWGKTNNVRVVIIRPPLLIGKNAPGNLAAMIKGIKTGKYANIRGGHAKRSMVLVEELVEFFPKLLEVEGVFNLTDGYNPSFKELSMKIGNHFMQTRILNIPKPIDTVLAKIGDFISFIFRKPVPFNSRQLTKMTNNLTFDDSKARAIGWNPSNVLNTTKKWL